MKASPKVKTAVLSVLKEYWRAYEEQDADAILEIMVPDEDAVFLGSGADERVYGPKELQAALMRDFAQGQAVKVTLRDVSIYAAGEVAWLYAGCRIKASTAEGDIILMGRFTAVLEKREERWLLAQTHFSVPDTLQAPGDSFPKRCRGRK